MFQQQKAFQAELAGSWAPGGPLGGGRSVGQGTGVSEGPRAAPSRPPHEKVLLRRGRRPGPWRVTVRGAGRRQARDYVCTHSQTLPPSASQVSVSPWTGRTVRGPGIEAICLCVALVGVLGKEMGTWTQGCGWCARGRPVGAPGVQMLCRLLPGARRGAVGPVLSCPLSSSQGDRGFDGLAGLPGEKGHRVSECCLGAMGRGPVGGPSGQP